ncbi:flagellar hook-length control protein FliK [Acetanaerobacterium elongatum]|uniref:Flagellar hook-length control protein FliK n=1 Tax=Acetanaerobacterium elongatum TaxID=258515 RepID=A0A1G9ZFR8_9FIRM|nr:flagellar hook-length control protein FliK [Acetanaerobacterium elongatum]SDN20272.1 Flagellar hook-length control protein FliK [Acetanaerobacterium elongatum]
MNVAMLTDMVLQVSGSNYGKPTAASQPNVQSTFSFSSELQKQLNSMNKEVNKATPKAATSSSQSEDVEADKAESEDKNEKVEAATSVLTAQTLQAAMVPQVLNVVDSQTQIAVPEVLLISQPQDSVVQAVNTVQDVSAVTAQVVQTAADMPQAQPVSTQPRQNIISEYLPQQGNPEVVQSTATQSSASFTPSGSFQNQTDTQTSNQPASQATESAPMATDKPATEKSDKDTVQQLTQQLSSFNDKLHNLGVTLKAEATAVTTVPMAPQTSPSEQVATGILNAYSNGKMEFTMKLKPESLGELTVKMVMNDGKLTMNIVTGNQQTAKLIESQIPELRASLKDSNVQMESCTVENQSFNNLASSGNYFMSGSDRENQPYETRRIVLARPIQEISSDDTTLAGGIIGARYVQQAMLNCYV